MNDESLKSIRARIDGIDDQILALINERASAAAEVAHAKQAAGESTDYYRPAREAEVLRRIRDVNAGPLSDADATRLFREIMSACLALQRPLTVAFLGPEGTFTQEAALKHFGHAIESSPLDNIDAVFREVESGEAAYGVVPVENSTEGMVTHTLDRLLSSPLQIVGEVEMPVVHSLATRAAEIASIRRIYSHSQGLAQCRAWVDHHLPGVERIPVASTAEAARLASLDETAAAIASEAAAERYDLPVMQAGMQDGSRNATRFLVLGHESPEPTGEDKTSLVIARENRPGGLAGLLAPLARYGLNMTRLESRPSPEGMWEYVFFVDLLGHAEDPDLKRALGEMQKLASLLKVLGSYPRSIA
ncbi:prephenate dehydratase [Spiribacter vilamensis]|uniref:Bifunctional chorismate mutase/prephenate dehydratase n=1 Tax=Spiribacter vilamensis TaxID=531306 RepID=A0A4Q8D0S4_9GAMM|nr:prephenate dehydratase [Spiribacter vilamensis]RZU98820.1 chorismate mutase [Spiribacter vilamensis]TVO62160.1 prephenate dehydratase [Spiribacter vilamensis]